MRKTRGKKYEYAADIVIHTDGKSALDICEEIVGKLLELDRREGRR